MGTSILPEEAVEMGVETGGPRTRLNTKSCRWIRNGTESFQKAYARLRGTSIMSEVADRFMGKRGHIVAGRCGGPTRSHEPGFPNPFYRGLFVSADPGGLRLRLDQLPKRTRISGALRRCLVGGTRRTAAGRPG